ncbi:MAG: hypothetical protein ACRC1H_16565, partial [Caldilineaceae bacterium]
NADRILVLDKGRVAAMGRHEELMEESPIYAEIYRSQLVEDATPHGDAPDSDLGDEPGSVLVSSTGAHYAAAGNGTAHVPSGDAAQEAALVPPTTPTDPTGAPVA